MSWRKVSMKDAMIFIAGKIVEADHDRRESPDSNAAVEWFTDGTAVGVVSCVNGPYSDVTPDVDIQPPKWYIYEDQ